MTIQFKLIEGSDRVQTEGKKKFCLKNSHGDQWGHGTFLNKNAAVELNENVQIFRAICMDEDEIIFKTMAKLKKILERLLI
jgi:hypothetical protein